jgi:hypothetical protein
MPTAGSLRIVGVEEETMAAGNGGRTVRLPAVVTLERDDLGEVDVNPELASVDVRIPT